MKPQEKIEWDMYSLPNIAEHTSFETNNSKSPNGRTPFQVMKNTCLAMTIRLTLTDNEPM